MWGVEVMSWEIFLTAAATTYMRSEMIEFLWSEEHKARIDASHFSFREKN